MPKHIVGAALIYNNSLLASQRAYPADLAGLWELPGGKIEAGESPLAAIYRELYEELGISLPTDTRQQTSPVTPFTTSTIPQISPTKPAVNTVTPVMLLPCPNTPSQAWPLAHGNEMLVYIFPLIEKPTVILTDSHLQHRWLHKQELFSVPWIPADLPIVKALAAHIENTGN